MKTIAIRSFVPLCISIAAALLAGCSKADHKPPTGVAGVTPEGRMEMQFKWIVGKQYLVRMDITSTSEATVPGQPKPLKQDVNMGQEYTVSVLKELPNNGRELELEFTGTRMESKMADRVVLAFDSTQDTSMDARNPIAPMLRKTVGGKLKYVIDNEGRVATVEGSAEFIARISQGVPPMIQAGFSGMYNEGYFKQLCDVGQMAPGRGVKPGDSWRTSFTEEMGSIGTMVVISKLKFENWETHASAKCARIESTSEITSKPSEAKGPAPAMTTRIEKGEARGTGWFDPDLGMVVESTSDQTMDMVITAQGKTIPSKAHQKVVFKLLKVTDMAK